MEQDWNRTNHRAEMRIFRVHDSNVGIKYKPAKHLIKINQILNKYYLKGCVSKYCSVNLAMAN
jgi:hypothetical protein